MGAQQHCYLRRRAEVDRERAWVGFFATVAFLATAGFDALRVFEAGRWRPEALSREARSVLIRS